ncbi:flavin monoamine oxidase family protein [Cupriavidus consociatus]|uniref:flavin monoamine oxidase family protein n=1 Tax=Cupriavidus consociatus TaxID=2821357 RepID=UPI001AE6229E|nr:MULTISPECIES: FAD-dependent oxidoreductase [unclassified Cupriavidus]MBP0623369.1 FAD-dependent oxidoreductase [Cupriavidus sp. LEh25]MDK2660066.1 FAD-dependent oxidoreductase [Cupriavidus sp. LEh21]
MQTAHIAIVGGGLSGLYAAFLLEEKGIKDYVVLEARDTLGGRIASTLGHPTPSVSSGLPDIDRFDLGPTWFWPALQPQLDRLVRDLDLASFAQHEVGDMMVERSSGAPPERMRGYVNSPAAMRLVGGMSAMIDALHRRLDVTRVLTGQRVEKIHRVDDHVELQSLDAAGGATTWRVERVLLAVPPRLAESMIEFTPSLPQMVARQWRNTATWMAPHAKYVAIFDVPFWREDGLSGEGRSAYGPLGEIHDASMPDGSAALFGFFGLPAEVRKRVPEDVLRAHCRAQLKRLFGTQAATPRLDIIKDWAQDRYTATGADLHSTGHHGEIPVATATSGPWSGRLTGIASEWSPRFSGYVAGAVEAVDLGLQALPAYAERGRISQ